MGFVGFACKPNGGVFGLFSYMEELGWTIRGSIAFVGRTRWPLSSPGQATRLYDSGL